MDIISIKTRLQDDLKTTLLKIQENPSYQNLKDKWEELPQNTKKIILIVTPFIIVLMLILPSYLSYSESENVLTEVQDKQGLIKILMLTQKDVNLAPAMNTDISLTGVKSRIENQILSDDLLPEQKQEVQISTQVSPDGIYSAIAKNALIVNLKNLTLRQAVTISSQIEAINALVKINTLNLSASVDNPGYLNLILEIITLNSAQEQTSESDSDDKPSSFMQPKFKKGRR